MYGVVVISFILWFVNEGEKKESCVQLKGEEILAKIIREFG